MKKTEKLKKGTLIYKNGGWVYVLGKPKYARLKPQALKSYKED